MNDLSLKNENTDFIDNSIQDRKKSFDLLIEKYQIKMPKILVFGVGGGGSQCVEQMYKEGLENVDFIIANTDINDLETRIIPNKILLGKTVAGGLGAGRDREVGKKAAEEDLEEIEAALKGFSMVFITAYMSGGTGTGATPVIAKKAREMGILVAVMVTKPPKIELPLNTKVANEGIEELKKYADTIIVIPMDNLSRIVNFDTKMTDAYAKVVDVITSGVKSITDLITKHGHINLDFADVRTNMKKMGRSVMGTGEASGENRAIKAVEEAINNPLLDNVSIRGTKGIIINITSSENVNFLEIEDCLNRIKEEIGDCSDTLMMYGNIFDEKMGDKFRVSIFATGIGYDSSLDSKKIVVDRENNASVEYREALVEKTYVFTGEEENFDNTVENEDNTVEREEGIDNIIEKKENTVGNEENDNECEDDFEILPYSNVNDFKTPINNPHNSVSSSNSINVNDFKTPINNIEENIVKKQTTIRRKIGEEIEEENFKNNRGFNERTNQKEEIFDLEDVNEYTANKNILNNRILSIEEQYKLKNKENNKSNSGNNNIANTNYLKLLESHKNKENNKKIGFFSNLFSRKKDENKETNFNANFSSMTRLNDYDNLSDMIEVNTYNIQPNLKKKKEE